MRYLGIDYGKKRIGLAVSDSGGRIAFPKSVMANRGDKHAADDLKLLIEEEEVSEIVVGLPISMDGRETEETAHVRRFVVALEKEIVLPIHLENEMLTTRMAKQEGIKQEHIDEAAAALILQSYLDKRLATRN